MDQETIELCRRVRQLEPGAVAKPTLVYFDIIGLGWPIRCLLHLGQVDYELIQISIAQWLERDESGKQMLKHSFRNGHVPLYVDDDVSLNQSQIILEYLAERHELAGTTRAERFAVKEVLWQCYDALFHWNGMLRVNIKGNLPDEIVEARLAAFMGHGQWPLVSEGYDNNLRAFERYLLANRSDSGFFVGDGLSVADLAAFNVLAHWYKAFDRERFVAGYPRLDAYIRRIAAIPTVADYIATRQEPTTWFRLPHIALRLTSPEEIAGLTD